ncbi:MAG: capsid assembly scaffolding protein Gp46 family protein [Paraclostridium sp.]
MSDKGEKIYTLEEFQREVDKRVTKALKTQEEKLNSKFSEDLESLKSDLTDEKEKAILNAITKERQEVTKARAELEHERLKTFISNNLSQRKMKTEFTDFILSTSKDQDSAIEQIEKFSSIISTSHEEFVNEKLVGQTPITPSVGEGDNKVRDGFVEGMGL